MSTGRTVAITGAASGIGAATAARLASDGHRVIGVDLRASNGVEVGADLGTAEGRATRDRADHAARGRPARRLGHRCRYRRPARSASVAAHLGELLRHRRVARGTPPGARGGSRSGGGRDQFELDHHAAGLLAEARRRLSRRRRGGGAGRSRGRGSRSAVPGHQARARPVDPASRAHSEEWAGANIRLNAVAPGRHADAAAPRGPRRPARRARSSKGSPCRSAAAESPRRSPHSSSSCSRTRRAVLLRIGGVLRRWHRREPRPDDFPPALEPGGVSYGAEQRRHLTLELAVARVLRADEVVEPPAVLLPLEAIHRHQYLLDVDPVLRAIEHRLADDEVLRRQDRDPVVAEGDAVVASRIPSVERVVGEEHVDRGPPPSAPDLTVVRPAAGRSRAAVSTPILPNAFATLTDCSVVTNTFTSTSTVAARLCVVRERLQLHRTRA